MVIQALAETLPPPAETEIPLTVAPLTSEPLPSVTLKVIVELPPRAMVLGLADAERDKPDTSQAPPVQVPAHKSHCPL